MNNRIEWIDACKGIAILCVILGHILMRTSMYPIEYKGLYAIYSFHMPLFFFVAGLTLKIKGNLKTWIKSKAKRLIVPAIFYSVLSVGFNIIFISLSAGVNETLKYIFGLVKFENILNAVLFTNKSPFVSYWFFPAIFMAYVLMWFFLQVDKKWMLCIIAIFMIICNRILCCINIALPLSIAEACMATAFMLISYCCDKQLKLWQGIVGALIWSGAFALWNNKELGVVDFYKSIIPNMFLFLAMGIGASFFVTSAFKHIYETKKIHAMVLEKIGNDSMHIYGMHYFFLEIYILLGSNINYSNHYKKYLFDIIGVIIVCSCCELVIFIIEKMKCKGIEKKWDENNLHSREK